MATGTPALYADFSGGINTEAGPYLVAENECQDARNISASPLGSFKKRRGFSKHSDLQDSGTVLLDGAPHSLFAVNLTTDYLLAVGPYYNNSDDAIVRIAGNGAAVALKTDAEPNTRWEFVQGPLGEPDNSDPTITEGPVYGLNGVDDPIQWDGTSNSVSAWTATGYTDQSPALDHPAKYCTMLIYSQDKLWAAGDTRTGYTGRVYSSGLNNNLDAPDPCNWDSNLTLDIEPDDGEIITGLGTLGPYIVVFKNRKTYVIDSVAALTYRVVSSSIGCVAPRSVVETNMGTFFLSEDMGVCITDGSSVTRLSEKIDPTLRAIARSVPLVLADAAAVFYENSYYLSVPVDGSTNEITLEYNLDTQSWWIHSCASNQFALIDPTGEPKLYSANPNHIVVNRAFDPLAFYDETATAQVAYESYWQGPYWAWGQPHLNKRISQLRIDGRGIWNTETATTFGDPYTNLGEGIPWESSGDAGGNFGGDGKFGDVDAEGDPPLTGSLFGPQAGVTQRRYPTPDEGWGRAWSIKITDNEALGDLEIYSIAAFTRPRTD